MASVVTRDVSETGVSVECLEGPAIPLYRIVYFQVDRSARSRTDLPSALRGSNVLSAIFRVGDYSQRTGKPAEYGLRLLVEPKAKSDGGRDAGKRCPPSAVYEAFFVSSIPAARPRHRPTAGTRRRPG